MDFTRAAKQTDDYVLPPGWNRQLDPSTKRYYYWNIATNETTWTPPSNSETNRPVPQSSRRQMSSISSGSDSRRARTVSTTSSSTSSSIPGFLNNTKTASTSPLSSPRVIGRKFAFEENRKKPNNKSHQNTLGSNSMVSPRTSSGSMVPPITHCNSPQINLSKRPTGSLAKQGSQIGNDTLQQSSNAAPKSVQNLKTHHRTLSNGGPPIISWLNPDELSDVQANKHLGSPTNRSFKSTSSGHVRTPSGAITSPLSKTRKNASTASINASTNTLSGKQSLPAPLNVGESDEWLPENTSPISREKATGLHRSFQLGRKRRGNIVAESYVPSSTTKNIVYAKTTEERRFLEGVLSEHYLFQKMNLEDRLELVDAMKSIEVAEGQYVIEEGESGEYFYVIGSGEFEVVIQDKPAVKMDKGCFGELALIYNCPRAASIVARTNSVVWALDRATFQQMIQTATRHHRVEAKAALKSIPLLKVLNEDAFDQIKGLVRFVDFKAGDEIIRKGDVGDAFYIIRSGRVICSEGETVDSDGKNTLELKEHDYFGERALLTDEPRAANVVALTEVKVMALDRHAFNTFLGPLKELLDYNIRATLLQDFALFRCMSPQEREKIFKAFVTEQFPAGTRIIRQGEAGTKFYLLRYGEVRVTQQAKLPNGMETTHELNVLSTGNYFGEMALTDGKPRLANVVAKTACECFVLDRVHFEELLGPARVILDREVSQRKIQNVKKSNQLAKALSPLSQQHAAAFHRRSSSLEMNQRVTTDYKLNEFKHVRTLGTGTFGRVRLVLHEPTGFTYALKIQSKWQITKHKLVENVFNEKKIMMQLHCPFIIQLYQTFSDRDCLYMLLELVPGGELFSLLEKCGTQLCTKDRVFYTSCVVSSFEAMHQCDILYRDLKPENLLIDQQGYLKLCDFGFAKVVKDTTFTLCGTPEYFSPELVLHQGYGKGNDYWAIGILIYEIMNGYTPFGVPEADQQLICKRIVKDKLVFPEDCDDDLGIDLVTQLLQKHYVNRLGCGRNGIQAIKAHQWFRNMNFDRLLKKEYFAPWTPKIKDKLDGSHFDQYPENYQPEMYLGDKHYPVGWDAEF